MEKFRKIINPAKAFKVKSRMKRWLSFETEAGQALEKTKLLGWFKYRDRIWYAAWFKMGQNLERSAGTYIVIYNNDYYDTAFSEFLAYEPETALDIAKVTADAFMAQEQRFVNDPLRNIGFASGKPESYKKTPEEIVRRAVAGLLVSQISPKTEDARILCRTLLESYGVTSDLLEVESKLLRDDKKANKMDFVRVDWYSEAVYAIMWAAGLHDDNILSCDEVYDAEKTAKIIKDSTLKGLIEKVSMRDIGLVTDAMLHLQEMEGFDERTGEIAYERLRGLSWLFSDDKDWGNMMLESRMYL